MKWLRNLPEWVLWLMLSPIIALAAIWIGSLAGCAHYDASMGEPLADPMPILPVSGQPIPLDSAVRCVVMHRGRPYYMTLQVSECRGWTQV